ncbi:MAG: tetratricopeptide repeat protein [Bryobacteraceae bacterium]
MDQTLSRAGNPAADFNRALHCSSDADAFDSLLRAAEGGCLRAQFLVGLAYHTGRGVAVDYARAGAWYREAAGSGDGHAIANLGVMSLLGQGTPADDVNAYTWVQSAVGLGHEWLRPALDWLERRVTGREAGDSDGILASISPETPAFRACTRPDCDHARCNVA